MKRRLFRSAGPGALLWLFTLAAGAVGELTAQQTGTISGVVTDRTTAAPLVGAQVAIPGVGLGGLTGPNGRYSIERVPVGSHQVRVSYLGYGSEQRTVQVTAAQPAQQNFSLQPAAINLEEIVVTGTGAPTERKQLGQTINAIDASELNKAPITSATEALQGRVPGLVGMSLGETGSGATIRLRGNVSITQRSEPIVYVDGVRVDASQFGQASIETSRLNDINPADIERIEVLKGAAAATLFGTEASAGVIQIFTKRGAAGAPRYSLQVDQQMMSMDQSRIPDNAAFDAKSGQIMRNRPSEDFVRTGHHQNYSLSVSGGTPGVRYFASGRWMDEKGTMPDNSVRNNALRMGLDFQHTDKLKTNIDANIIRNTTRAPYPWWGLMAEFVLANPVNASPTRPYGELDYGINGVLQYDNSQEVSTTTLSGTASYTWSPQLQSSVTLGMNETNLQEILFVPLGASPRAGPGQRQITDRARSNLTLDVKNSWNVRIGERLTSTLAVGGQSFWEDLTQRVVDVRNFPSPTLQTLRGGSEVRQVDEFQEQVINAGIFVQEQLGINDRLFLTAGVRFDGNSAFGENFGMETYPKFGASWVVSDEPFWSVPVVDVFRLRAAYGTSGLQPGAFDAQRTWAATRGINNNTAVRPLNLGNPDLKPERSTERELGAEIGLFGGRLGLEVVYYDQQTTDALLPKQGPPTQGFLNPQLTNIGRLQSNGVESTLNLRVLERSNFTWTMDATYTTVDQMVVDMGGVAPYNIAGGQRYSRIQEGYAPGAVVAAVTDPNRPYVLSVPVENLTSLSQIQPNWLKGSNGLDSLVFIGNSSPTWTASLGSTISLPAGVELRALLAGAGGFVISNETEFIREGIGITESAATKQQALANPSTSAEERRRIADEYGRRHPRVPTHWMEDGDYFQLSEVSLSFPVPQRLSGRFGLEQTSIMLAGRNLALFTDYSGIITPGSSRSRYGGAFLQNIDYFGAPVPRRLVLSLRTNF